MIRSVTEADADVWEHLRELFWPTDAGEHGREKGEHSRDIAKYFNGDRREPAEVLLAINHAGRVVGFTELSIRNIVDGCSTGRVAYLEGWFVEEEERGKGFGAALMRASEDWGRAQGCTEFASDTEITNELSISMHTRLGFEETGRVAQFRKEL